MRVMGRRMDLCPLGNSRSPGDRQAGEEEPVGTESLHQTFGGCHEAREHRFVF